MGALGFTIIINLYFQHASSEIPLHHYEWDEPPDSAIFVAEGKTVLTREQSLERLTAFRAVLSEYEVDGYIIPTADAHNSQYIAACDARREWISGLSGSSGTAVVTSQHALVWTDARYYTQFEMEVDTALWQLMRTDDLSIQSWLMQNLAQGSRVAVDPTTYSYTSFSNMEQALLSVNITLVSIPLNLVDLARSNIGDPAPPRPNNPLIPLSIDFTDTLNIRGSDIPYNPVFFSYLILRADQALNNVILFWGNGTVALSPEITEHLTTEGITLQINPYDTIFEYVYYNMSSILPTASTIWLSSEASLAIHLATQQYDQDTTMTDVSILSTLSPVALIKCVKNEVELAGFRSAHVKDGTAVVRFLRWIHVQVDAGVNVTEVDASDKLEELRGEEADFMGPSFATIAGAGENGAVIHYKPSREGPQRVITRDDMFLVDSGGQYRDGTTDITRTRHMGSPTEAQKRAFTRVLKGQINMGTAVFPRGIVGHRLETLARKALWDVGLDYGHGTGHGVGHYLNVHEGPSWILSGPVATDPGIVAGMIFSNEPGYYEVGEYGIRHEDLVEVIDMNTNSDHILAEGLVDNFAGVGALGFYTISLAPHQRACIDIDLLNDFEIKYLNDYHARVLSTLGPILLERNLTEDYDWLQSECAPILRNAAAILKTSATILISISVCVARILV